MRPGTLKCVGWWVLSAALASAGGPFVTPADGPVPFRRDRVPLEVDAMTGLSRELTLLAQTVGTEQPADRRKIAQTLALALALDPANRDARELILGMGEQKPFEPVDETKAEKSKARIWQLLGWLEAPEAGADGQALAACLTDVAVVIDPFHPSAQEHKKDTGAWNGWIPELAAYQPKEAKPVEPQVEPTERSGAKSTATFARKVGSVTTPLWSIEKDNSNGREIQRYVLKPRVISMRPTNAPDEDGGGFKFILQSTQNYRALAKESDVIVKALKAAGDVLPDGGHIYLDCSGDYLVDTNRKAISAAAAVLMDAAVTGREPAATVMGIIGEDGSFKLPPRAWDRLRALSEGPGGRLVLPRDAEKLLPSILAMEDAAFFMKYEVILAGSVKELVERSAKDGKGTLAEISERFAEIRSKQGTTAVGQYAANRFVRQRLADIAQAYPDHASARMLDVQGAGKRPTTLPRPILASEIRRSMEPVGMLVKGETYNLEIDAIEKAFEGSRSRFDPLERYVDIRDRDLVTRGKDVLTAVRNLVKARRGKDEEYGSQRYQTAVDAAKGAYESFRRDLDSIAADEDT